MKRRIQAADSIRFCVRGRGAQRLLGGFLLFTEKTFDLLDALGIGGGDHLRHFNDPVTLQLAVHVVVVQPPQVIREPFILDCQQPEESGLSWVSPVGSVGASKCLQHFEVATGDPHPCPPTRQSMVSNLHPGWNTRLMAPSKKIFMASQVYSSSAAPRKWCRTWAIRSIPSHYRPFR